MRYRKGSIDIGSGQDRRLLEQVLKSQFVSHSQLWEFLHANCYEISRNSYCWRVNRLVAGGILVVRSVPQATNERVYALGELGVSKLQSFGSFYCEAPSIAEKRARTYPHVEHALTLNDIHLQLLRTGTLREWIPEVEIRSRNDFTTEGFVKDYDAIVTLKLDGESMTFGLEYERSAKRTSEYLEVERLLERETKVDLFVYLVAGEHLRSLLMQCFHRRGTRAIYVGLLHDLVRENNPAYVPLVQVVTWEATTLGRVAAGRRAGTK